MSAGCTLMILFSNAFVNFDLIAKTGNSPERDMFNTFNMGVGMCMAVSKETADAAIKALNDAGEKAFVIGEVVEGDEGVILC